MVQIFNKKYMKYIEEMWNKSQLSWTLFHDNSVFDISTIRPVLGSVIGSGSFGQINSLITISGISNKYAVKIQYIGESEDMYTFKNELNVGKNIKLSTLFVGVTIYCYTLLPIGKNKITSEYTYLGVYIMDHIERGFNNVISYTLDKYISQYTCPLPKSGIIYSLENALLSFYKITKGYHGDLHPGNIAIITDKNNNFLYTLIFDYGSHIKFKNTRKLHECTTLKDMFKLIENEFKANVNNPNTYKKLFPNVSKDPGLRKKYSNNNLFTVVYPNRGQPYRSNVNTLRKYHPLTSQLITSSNQYSLYNGLTQNSKVIDKLKLISKIATLSNDGKIKIKKKYRSKISQNIKDKISLNSHISVLESIVKSIE